MAQPHHSKNQDDKKGGAEFKGASLHDGFDGFGL